MSDSTSFSSTIDPDRAVDQTTAQTDYYVPDAWMKFLRREDLEDFHVAGHALSTGRAQPIGHVRHDRASRRFPHSQFSVIRDETGSWVVADHFGAAMGVGASPSAALKEWASLAAEQLTDLRANAHRLHPRLHAQLEFLSSWFGW